MRRSGCMMVALTALGVASVAVGILSFMVGEFGLAALMFILGVTPLIWVYHQRNRQKKQETKKQLWRTQIHRRHPEMLSACSFIHISGLSVDQSRPVDAVLYPDMLLFDAGGKRFKLPKERIAAITCKQDVKHFLNQTVGTGSPQHLGYVSHVEDHFVVDYRSAQGESKSITLRFLGNEGREFAGHCNAMLIGNNITL